MSGIPHDSHQTGTESYAALRTKALESLLVEKGLITTDVIDTVVRAYEQNIGPLNGARVVARAWVDPAYKQRLLADGTSAIAELGFGGRQGVDMVVLENTPAVHNVVVCTLCSCYPSYASRARVVREPRVVLREFGLELPEAVEIRVWDSNSDIRYMVLPERPAGTEHLSEADLVPLVTRDAMIGVARVQAPATPARR